MEENVWKLCEFIKNEVADKLSDCFAVFISNDDRVIPLWEQASSNKNDGLVFWDYHVIFIQRHSAGSVVYDLDTRLPFPCQFGEYIGSTVKPDEQMQPRFKRYFRVIEAKEFLATFASDRSHMLNAEGKWLEEPPEYPCIQTEASQNNIQTFISMDRNAGHGKVMDQPELWKFFTATK